MLNAVKLEANLFQVLFTKGKLRLLCPVIFCFRFNQARFFSTSWIWLIHKSPESLNKYTAWHVEQIHALIALILNGGFLKWYPTTMGFPAKNDHDLGCEMGGKPTILGNTRIVLGSWLCFHPQNLVVNCPNPLTFPLVRKNTRRQLK